MSTRIPAHEVIRNDQVRDSRGCFRSVIRKDMPPDLSTVALRLSNGTVLNYAGSDLVEISDVYSGTA